MARILAISSQVARGHVGLSAIVPTLQALGHEVIALPTVLLSNHPGHAHVAGERVSPDLLRRMVDALDANGWLGEVDALLTGYLPSVEHVQFARDVVQRLRRPGVRYVCDPVIGDDPKGLYIARDAAEAIRDLLVPKASMITPNRFELEFLSGVPVRNCDDALRAMSVARLTETLAKSLPDEARDHLINLGAFAGIEYGRVRFPRRAHVPHGTGDVLTAFVAGYRNTEFGLGVVTAALSAIIDASAGRNELDLRALPRDMAAVTPFEITFNPKFAEQFSHPQRDVP